MITQHWLTTKTSAITDSDDYFLILTIFNEGAFLVWDTNFHQQTDGPIDCLMTQVYPLNFISYVVYLVDKKTWLTIKEMVESRKKV